MTANDSDTDTDPDSDAEFIHRLYLTTEYSEKILNFSVTCRYLDFLIYKISSVFSVVTSEVV